MSKLQIISDKNKKSSKIKNLLLKKIKSNYFKKENYFKRYIVAIHSRIKILIFSIYLIFSKNDKRIKFSQGNRSKIKGDIEIMFDLDRFLIISFEENLFIRKP